MKTFVLTNHTIAPQNPNTSTSTRTILVHEARPLLLPQHVAGDQSHLHGLGDGRALAAAARRGARGPAHHRTKAWGYGMGGGGKCMGGSRRRK
jgi:hypothetical protein